MSNRCNQSKRRICGKIEIQWVLCTVGLGKKGWSGFGQNLASERLPIYPQSYWARLRNPALSRRDYKTKPNRFWILKTLQNLTRARCRCPNRDTEGWYSDLARSICTFLIFYFDKNPLKVRNFLFKGWYQT